MLRLFIFTMTTVLMSGCMTVAKTTGSVAALPFKATYHTGKAVGKGVIGTGKAVYYVGSVPVKITDKALDTSIKVLTVTTKMVDLSGKVVTVSRQIQASQLEAELSGLSRATNVLSVVVDAYV